MNYSGEPTGLASGAGYSEQQADTACDRWCTQSAGGDRQLKTPATMRVHSGLLGSELPGGLVRAAVWGVVYLSATCVIRANFLASQFPRRVVGRIWLNSNYKSLVHSKCVWHCLKFPWQVFESFCSLTVVNKMCPSDTWQPFINTHWFKDLNNEENYRGEKRQQRKYK